VIACENGGLASTDVFGVAAHNKHTSNPGRGGVPW
jgi:hypothetical protein